MYFETNLSVIIDGFNLTTVVKVDTHNDANKAGASCDIEVPLNSYITYKNPNNLKVFLTEIKSNSYPQGTPISITANYEGMATVQVFSGFVYDFVLGTPMTIKCLDYIYFANLGIFGDKHVATTNKAGTKIKNSGTGVNYKSVQFKDLLQQLVNFTNTQIDLDNKTFNRSAAHIELILPTIDFELVNLTFIHMSVASILEYIKKNIGLNITFYGNKLWVNVASQTVGTINLSTAINVIKSNMQTQLAAFQQVRLKCWYITNSGTRTYYEVGDTNGIQQERFFYNVPHNETLYNRLANEALLRAEQHFYRGELELLLYPDCDLFFIVNYRDIRYPEKNGQYYITGVNIRLDHTGFHRWIKLAILNTPTYNYLSGKAIISN